MPVKKRGARREPEINEGEVIQDAIGEGMERLTQDHPKFKNYGEFINGHIDKIRMRRKLFAIRDALQKEQGMSKEDQLRYLHAELSDYVASGEALDKSGKSVILKNSLEGKTGKKDDEIERAGEAFRDLYGMMKQGDYARRMPEFAEAVTTVYDLGFLDSSLEVLDSYGLLNKRSYAAIKEKIKGRYREVTDKIGDVYERTIEPRKEKERGLETEEDEKIQDIYKKQKLRRAAAVFFAIFGIAIITLSEVGITGNVIGAGSSNIYGALIGALLLIVAWIMFFKRKKTK